MPLREKIDTDYKNALKSKDKIQISTYRLILSGIKDLDISNRSGPNKKNNNMRKTKEVENMNTDIELILLARPTLLHI